MLPIELQEVCTRIVTESGDAILYSDREGIIRLWNRGAENIFGFTAGEAVGASLDIIIPEKLRDRHWSGYNRVMETGSTVYADGHLAVPALRKDGSRISVEFTVVLVAGMGGKPAGVAAILRNVTERWEKERFLAERLAQLEKQQK